MERLHPTDPNQYRHVDCDYGDDHVDNVGHILACLRHYLLLCSCQSFFFFFNDTATTEIYTLSLHDALPIYPMADGPAIQASSVRALNAGMSLKRTLALVERFRRKDRTTPLVLMGYYNPIHAYGAERFARDAGAAGVDGLITVDLGPEEDSFLRGAAAQSRLDIIRLATPTTDDARLATVLNGASGFLYYVSIAGVTGTKTFTQEDVKRAVQRIRQVTDLPCVAGFGI